MGPHWPYIAAAYGLVAVTLAGIVAWLMVDGRDLERRIADLEARGIRRRSAGQDGPAGDPSRRTE